MLYLALFLVGFLFPFFFTLFAISGHERNIYTNINNLLRTLPIHSASTEETKQKTKKERQNTPHSNLRAFFVCAAILFHLVLTVTLYCAHRLAFNCVFRF